MILLFTFNIGFAHDQPKLQKVKVSLPLFKTYQVNSLYPGIAAKVDLNSNPKKKLFRTAIKTEYKILKLNFAGHYCLVHWGCGSECQESAIVDLVTGKVYDGVDASLGYKFETNSRMVIINPLNDKGEIDDYFCRSCRPEVWIWNEITKKFYSKKLEFTSSSKEVN